MFTLTTTGTTQLNVFELILTLNTDEEFDYWTLEYRKPPSTTFISIARFIPLSTKVYTWQPPTYKGSIEIKAIGVKKSNVKSLLLTHTDRLTTLAPVTIIQIINLPITSINSTGAVTNLAGSEITAYRSQEPITYAKFIKGGNIVAIESQNYKEYELTDGFSLNLFKDEANPTGEDFYKKLEALEKDLGGTLLTYPAPVLVDNYTQALLKLDNKGQILQSGIIPRLLEDSIPAVMQIYQPQYTPLSVCGRQNGNYLYSAKVEDDISFQVTDANGEFVTERKYRPGYLVFSLGKTFELADKSDPEFFLNNFTYTELDADGNAITNKVIDQTNIRYLLSGIYCSGMFVSDSTIIINVPSDRAISAAFSIDVTVYDEDIKPFSGVTVNSSTTDGSGICVFSNLWVGDYIITPSYPHYTFTPESTTVSFVYQDSVNNNTEQSVSFVGTPYYLVSGCVVNQNGDSLRESINIAVKDVYTNVETIYTTTSSFVSDYVYRPSSYIATAAAPRPGVDISPSSIVFSIAENDFSGLNFSAYTHSILGSCYDLTKSGIDAVEVSVYSGALKATSDYAVDETETLPEAIALVTTNTSGLYVVDRLLPGMYTLRAKKVEINIEQGIDYIKRAMGLTEDSFFILELRTLAELNGEDGFAAYLQNIDFSSAVDSMGASTSDVSTFATNSLLTGFYTTYYFAPEQKIVEVGHRDVANQDFFREKTYNFDGRFFDEYNEAVPNMKYIVLSDNRRALYNSKILKVNGVDFSLESKGEVLRDASNLLGGFSITNLLRGVYTIAPYRVIESWQDVTDDQGNSQKKWVPEQTEVYNFGYTFQPKFRELLLYHDYSGIDFGAYTGEVTGSILDNTNTPVVGVMVELVGGDYHYETDNEGIEWPVPKQTQTNVSGIYVFTNQLPDTTYDIYPYREVSGI